jgi:hypothetical protein
MTVEQDLQALGNFNVTEAVASLWVFKKRPATGQMNPFTAVSVLMSDSLRDQLKALASSYQTSHTIAEEYNLLSQTCEGGFRGCAEFCVNGQSTAAQAGLSVSTMNTKKHDVPEELLASLLADYKKPEDLIGENGLLKQLTKLLVEKSAGR